jgi:hypothetical protein
MHMFIYLYTFFINKLIYTCLYRKMDTYIDKTHAKTVFSSLFDKKFATSIKGTFISLGSSSGLFTPSGLYGCGTNV